MWITNDTGLGNNKKFRRDEIFVGKPDNFSYYNPEGTDMRIADYELRMIRDWSITKNPEGADMRIADYELRITNDTGYVNNKKSRRDVIILKIKKPAKQNPEGVKLL